MIKRKLAIREVEQKLCYMRCFEETLIALTTSKVLPKPICFEPSIATYKLKQNDDTIDCDNINLYLFETPINNLQDYEIKLDEMKSCDDFDKWIVNSQNTVSLASNNFIEINSLGHWIQIVSCKRKDEIVHKFKPGRWLLKYSNEAQLPKLSLEGGMETSKQKLAWLTYVQNCYSLVKDNELLNKFFMPNDELMTEISKAPTDWSLEDDEELARFLKDNLNIEAPGSIKNIVKIISLSSQRTTDDVEFLMSSDRKTYWESDTYMDSYSATHSIKISLKPNIIIRRLYIVVNRKDKKYLPKDVVVYGGTSPDDCVQLNEKSIKLNASDEEDVLILDNCKKSYDYIEIRIKSCHRSGNNCRIYGIKAFTQLDDEEYLANSIFHQKILERNFSRIGSYPHTFLYRRSKLLFRFIHLFDLCIDTMLPSWSFGKRFEQNIQSIKELLILSTKRTKLIDRILRKIPSNNCYPPSIQINRQLATQHADNPLLDPECQNTVFIQIYKQLKQETSSYNFRWDKDVEQWWECKFIGEGIIDQGGGFRDTISDISEELCPSVSNKPVPLPYFIRSPNHHQSDLTTYKDTFVLNPSCHDYEKYEFIGKLMGACLRSKESLVLFLAPFVWKKISGQPISWVRDFATVDAAEVKLLDTISKMDENEYNSKYAKEKTWTCILSDGTTYQLKPNGSEEYVSYEDRLNYIELVKKARLGESDKQLQALKSGLEWVISRHVLSILTWSEIENKICGSPEITIEDLKMSIDYDDLLPTSNRVKYFWEAISNFTTEERSKFLRFVTGRKRLPVKIFFCASEMPITSFPDSSTCNCTIYFPNYTSAKMAEEKLKYAIYNCVAIDADLTSYDEE